MVGIAPRIKESNNSKERNKRRKWRLPRDRYTGQKSLSEPFISWIQSVRFLVAIGYHSIPYLASLFNGLVTESILQHPYADLWLIFVPDLLSFLSTLWLALMIGPRRKVLLQCPNSNALSHRISLRSHGATTTKDDLIKQRRQTLGERSIRSGRDS